MVNNTEQSRTLLEKALRSLPVDNALSGARSYISRALSEINFVEKRRVKRATHQNERDQKTLSKQWEEKIKQGLANPLTPFGTLSYIDRMIKAEQLKSEQSKKQNQVKLDADMETFLG